MQTRVLAALFLLAFIPYAYSETDKAAPAYIKKNAAESSARMDKIISTQEEILKQLKEIKNELYVIKIRATK